MRSRIDKNVFQFPQLVPLEEALSVVVLGKVVFLGVGIWEGGKGHGFIASLWDWDCSLRGISGAKVSCS